MYVFMWHGREKFALLIYRHTVPFAKAEGLLRQTVLGDWWIQTVPDDSRGFGDNMTGMEGKLKWNGGKAKVINMITSKHLILLDIACRDPCFTEEVGGMKSFKSDVGERFTQQVQQNMCYSSAYAVVLRNLLSLLPLLQCYVIQQSFSELWFHLDLKEEWRNVLRDLLWHFAINIILIRIFYILYYLNCEFCWMAWH